MIPHPHSERKEKMRLRCGRNRIKGENIVCIDFVFYLAYASNLCFDSSTFSYLDKSGICNLCSQNRNYKSLCRGLLIYQIGCRNISRRAAESAKMVFQTRGDTPRTCKNISRRAAESAEMVSPSGSSFPAFIMKRGSVPT